MSAARWRVGLGLVVLYAAAAVVTHQVATDGIRPLFDGFAPRAPYRWVKPPPELAAGNMPPQAAERTIPVSAPGSEPANVSTLDAQAILTLPGNAIAPHPADTAVVVKVTPVDPGTLGPLPPDRRAVANAYQFALAYQPSGAPVTQVATSAIVALTANTAGDVLLFSPDGQAWQEIPARPFGQTDGLTGTFRGPGYYVVAASPQARAATTSPGDGGDAGAGAGGRGSTLVALVVAVGAGGAVLGVMLVLRRRGRP